MRDPTNCNYATFYRSACRYALLAAAAAAMLAVPGTANAGPCTVQIAQIEQQIANSGGNPMEGPSAPESVASERQPTPRSVDAAEHKATEQFLAALDRARTADTKGDATACTEALRQARQLYGID